MNCLHFSITKWFHDGLSKIFTCELLCWGRCRFTEMWETNLRFYMSFKFRKLTTLLQRKGQMITDKSKIKVLQPLAQLARHMSVWVAISKADGLKLIGYIYISMWGNQRLTFIIFNWSINEGAGHKLLKWKFSQALERSEHLHENYPKTWVQPHLQKKKKTTSDDQLYTTIHIRIQGWLWESNPPPPNG